MAHLACSMFGHILYDDNLTFQELLETEERVKESVQTALAEHGAQFFEFSGEADSLYMECMFPEMNRENNQRICESIIRGLGSAVLARFMFVDRTMNSAAFYFLGRGKWHEQALSIPGPREALSGWVVRQERKAGGTPPRRRPLAKDRPAAGAGTGKAGSEPEAGSQ